MSVKLAGRIDVVKPRTVLHRSFHQTWHYYKGYELVLDDAPWVAGGPAIHEMHRFVIGKVVSGVGEPA